MDGDWVSSSGGAFRLLVRDELERYRAETLLTKEPETIAWIDHFAPSGVFFDVGANIGIYSLYAASRSAALRVFAFEPYFRNQFHLVENVLGNGFSNVVPLSIALGREVGVVDLQVPDDRFGASGAQIIDAIDEDGAAFDPVERISTLVLTLDVVVHQLGLPAPTFVKIDVDGVELAILDGMARVLGNPSLQSGLVEVNLARSDAQGLGEIFGKAGLRPDDRFNGLADHSRVRRATNARPVENVVYSRDV